ncbi:sugar ABC transporter permease [Clostridium sediminicola]|uniref:carbohydrate ABC transporter permease n=1 Tax=Clostridium sediminicola TaxID=3114879 RepID=UPI0031F237E3
MTKKSKKWAPFFYMFPALLFILIFIYIPIIENFYYSFFKMNSYSDNVIFVGLQNYKRIFSDSIFYTALKNNGLYALISLICQIGFGLFLAIILESSLINKKMKNIFRNIYFLPSLISITAIGLLWYFIYSPNIGLINAVLTQIGREDLTRAWLGNPKTAIFGVIAMSQWQWVGYITMLLIVAIQKIPTEQYEAAEIDGASGVQKAFLITIPNIKEMTLVTSVITVIGAFQLFTEVYILTMGGPYDSTQVLGTYMYDSAFIYDEMGYASAIAVIIFVITFTLSVLELKISKSGKE